MFEKRIGIGRKPSVRLTNQSVPDKIYCAGEAVYFTRKEQTDRSVKLRVKLGIFYQQCFQTI